MENILEKIPQEIIEKYEIEISDGRFRIHSPYHIGIGIDELFEVEEDKHTVSIKNSKCAVSLWKNGLITHTTVF